MKDKAKNYKKIQKIILIVIKAMFNKTVGFFANLCILMIPFAYVINFSINDSNIFLVIFALILYPIFFEMWYRFYLKKELYKLHLQINKAINDIDNNK
jgi:heme/copper-type cytochrome/quinol oxidase subunit 4